MMLKYLASLALLAVLIAPVVVRADDNPSNNNLSYDDPSVHYAAPDGFTRVDIPPDAKDAPNALFQKQISRYDTRAITLKIADYSGSLDGLEGSHESDLHSNNDGLFVEKKTKTTLSNGMPVWMVKYSMGQGAGRMIRAVEYVAFDGRRSIILTYAGAAGDFTDKDALDAMSTLTVVVYPEGRP
jgi:hypothetical protein